MEQRRHTHVPLVACAIVMVSCPFGWARYGGGTGTASDPYLIETAEHLRSVGVYRSDWHYHVHYKLTADIDMADLKTPMEPIGAMALPFMGDFDGNGKTISNLTIVRSSGDYVGLFGCCEASIHDLRLVNVEISAPQSTCVGALAGQHVGREMRRCFVESGTVSGRDEVGGLVGSSGGTVSQCYTACKVAGVNKVGGLLGLSQGPYPVSQCYSTANVTGSLEVGGLVGVGRGIVRDCYATGEVYGAVQAGGLVGSAGADGQIWNCYSAGRARTDWGPASGLSSLLAQCYSSFWDVEVNGQGTASCGYGRTTTQMRAGATFLGWGRSGAWKIDEGADYPRLAWESRPGVPLTTPAFPGNEGDGTAQRPYLIHTAQELNAVGDFPGEWDRHYRLEADIDLAGLEGSFRTVGCEHIYFTGTFDGGGHSISNLVCSYADYGSGLFGFTRDATIRRVTLIDPRNESEWAISVGTLVGQQVEGIVADCGAQGGSVASSHFVGGLVGRCAGGTVTRCYSTCAVTGRNVAEDVGGLVGRGERCNINNSYATGAVAGQKNTGGLLGRTEAGSITHCYSVGPVTGVQNVGGLIGLITDKTLVTGCFWDTLTSGYSTSAAGKGATTGEMQKAATFIAAGWDFAGERQNGTTDIWCIDEGKGYPQFSPAPTQERMWADDFEDGEPAPLWRIYEPEPSDARLRETGGRLELHAGKPLDSVRAVYYSDGWRLDVAQDFSVKIDFRFSRESEGEGWVSLSLVPSLVMPVGQCSELRAGCLDNEPCYTGILAGGIRWANWPAMRGTDNGTLYLSYDAGRDELYLSFTGYGPRNAWHVVTGLLKDEWAGKPVCVVIGGAAAGMTLEGTDAWLDNFVIDTGVPLP